MSAASDFGGGPIEPTFFAMQVNERTCQRCGADYTAHGSRLECPAWAFEQALRKTPDEKQIIRQWILTKVTLAVIPMDEGNEEEFMQNLLALLEEDK